MALVSRLYFNWVLLPGDLDPVCVWFRFLCPTSTQKCNICICTVRTFTHIVIGKRTNIALVALVSRLSILIESRSLEIWSFESCMHWRSILCTSSTQNPMKCNIKQIKIAFWWELKSLIDLISVIFDWFAKVGGGRLGLVGQEKLLSARLDLLP